MVMTLLAELLSGETMLSPGGPVDRVTACGIEPFLWESWLAGPASEAATAPATPSAATPV